MYTNQMQEVLDTHKAFVGDESNKQKLQSLIAEIDNCGLEINNDYLYHQSLEEMDFNQYLSHAYLKHDIFSSYGNIERKSINLKDTVINKEDLSRGLLYYM